MKLTLTVEKSLHCTSTMPMEEKKDQSPTKMTRRHKRRAEEQRQRKWKLSFLVYGMRKMVLGGPKSFKSSQGVFFTFHIKCWVHLASSPILPPPPNACSFSASNTSQCSKWSNWAFDGLPKSPDSPSRNLLINEENEILPGHIQLISPTYNQVTNPNAYIERFS